MAVSSGSFSLYTLLTDKRWRTILKEEFEAKYMRDIEEFLRIQYAKVCNFSLGLIIINRVASFSIL